MRGQVDFEQDRWIVAKVCGVFLAALIIALFLLAALFPARAATITTPRTIIANTPISDLTISKAPGTIIRNCPISGTVSIQNSDSVLIDGCTISGPNLVVNKWSGDTSHSKYVRFRNCAFTGLAKGQLSGEHAVVFWNTDWLTIDHCRFIVRMEPNTDLASDAAEGCFWFFDCPDMNVVDSYLDLQTSNLSQSNAQAPLRFRADIHQQKGCPRAHWDRDTVIVTGWGGRVLMSSSGTDDGTDGGRYGLWDAHFRDCIFNATNVTSYSQFYWQGGMKRDTLERCTFASKGPALYAFDISGSLVKDCVLKGTDGVAIKLSNEYRPSQTGGLTACGNTVTGNVTIAPALLAAGVMVACADMTPPAAITTLRAGQAQGDSVKLTWTPPADAVGTEIRCSQSLAAIQAGGGFSAFVRSRGNGWAWVTVPTPGTWWRYAVITRDAAGNWSKPSNVASAYAAPIAVIVALGALAAAAGAAVVATRRRVPPQA